MVEANIDNEIWLKPTKEQYDDIRDVFLEHGSYINKANGSSENYEDIFYCIYDQENKIYTVVFKGS